LVFGSNCANWLNHSNKYKLRHLKLVMMKTVAPTVLH